MTSTNESGEYNFWKQHHSFFTSYHKHVMNAWRWFCVWGEQLNRAQSEYTTQNPATRKVRTQCSVWAPGDSGLHCPSWTDSPLDPLLPGANDHTKQSMIMLYTCTMNLVQSSSNSTYQSHWHKSSIILIHCIQSFNLISSMTMCGWVFFYVGIKHRRSNTNQSEGKTTDFSAVN